MKEHSFTGRGVPGTRWFVVPGYRRCHYHW